MHHIYDDGAFVAFAWNNLDKITIDKMIDYTIEYRRDPKERQQEKVSAALNKILKEEDNTEIILEDGESTTLKELNSFDYLVKVADRSKI